MTRPTWEECRAANMSCREAAEARGVDISTALVLAYLSGWKWRGQGHEMAAARMTALHQDPAFKAAHAARGRARMIAMNKDPNIRTPARLAAMAVKASARMTAMNKDPAFNPLVLLTPSERVAYDDLIRKRGSTRAQVLAFIGRADLVRDVMR